jgi:hypothetical protein
MPKKQALPDLSHKSAFQSFLSLVLYPLYVVFERAVVREYLHVNAITLDLSFLLKTIEIRHDVLGETELSGDEDSLATSELKLGASEGHFCVLEVLRLNSN